MVARRVALKEQHWAATRADHWVASKAVMWVFPKVGNWAAPRADRMEQTKVVLLAAERAAKTAD